ncbi:phosphoribosyltransferase family protein [Planctomicrobium sp. SH527]|uniref:phosphoribosyltransferase family protein n=1 Tax=Planctomicrobium sp. SH527 TaxID=3448123 RepID=UPI003F5AE8A9
MRQRWAFSLVQDALDFVYPPHCQWCGSRSPRCRIKVICDTCEQTIAPVVKHRCECCSAPVGPYLQTQSGCPHCNSGKRLYQQAVSLGAYDGPLKQVCIQSKLPGQRPLARTLAIWLCERSGQQMQDWGCDLIVSIPHFWMNRIRHSDHNADAITETLGKHLKLPVHRHVVSKRRWTPRQHTLTASMRRKNLRDAFQITRFAKIAGKRILIADDVLTTGTTVNRLSEVLLNAGAASVHVAVLARTLNS